MVLSRVRLIRVRLVLVNLNPINDTYIQEFHLSDFTNDAEICRSRCGHRLGGWCVSMCDNQCSC